MIKCWENHLRANEAAKVEAIKEHDDYIVRNESFETGSSIESSVTNTKSKTTSNSGTFKTEVSLEAGTDIEIFSLEMNYSSKNSISTSVTVSGETQTESSVTTGYILAEAGDDDALTIDVFNAPDGNGAIFVTRGGQTSCPYEGEQRTQYFEPGKHVITTIWGNYTGNDLPLHFQVYDGENTYSFHPDPELLNTFNGVVGSTASPYCIDLSPLPLEKSDARALIARKGAGASIAPFRAYLKRGAASHAPRRNMSASIDVPQRLTVYLTDRDGGLTAVGMLDTQSGQVTFNDNAWYSLDGRPLPGRPEIPGVYINGARKVVIR